MNMACAYIVLITIFIACKFDAVDGRRSEAKTGEKELSIGMEQELSENTADAVNNYLCCKVGEKLARKGLSCSTYYYASQTSGNGKVYTGQLDGHQSKQVQRLSAKAAVCVSQYSMNLKKCCNLFEDFKAEMESCKIYQNGRQRKVCREGVKFRYPY